MKTCSNCEETNIEKFKKYTGSRCIDCYRIAIREYSNKNRERIRNRQQEYQKKNKNILSERRREYIKNNTENIQQNQKKFREKNPEYGSTYSRNRYKTDFLFRLKRNISNLIRIGFINKNIKKPKKAESILGCSFEEFKIYLESKFEDWMTWENRGLYNGELDYGWDIDHIIPISSAKNEEELIKLNHFTNLQPLCSKINRDIKKARL